CGSWRIFVVAVGAFSLWQLAEMQNYKKRRERRVFFGKSGVLFEKSKVIFYIPTYYKPITFSSFTLNTIKFCPRTIAIPDIFPNFASTFLTNEMNMKKQL
uniref:hypothetical protein n=1 Tax=Prevotella sp. TaxID=59823 RepID=UPI003FEDECEE